MPVNRIHLTRVSPILHRYIRRAGASCLRILTGHTRASSYIRVLRRESFQGNSASGGPAWVGRRNSRETRDRGSSWCRSTGITPRRITVGGQISAPRAARNRGVVDSRKGAIWQTLDLRPPRNACYEKRSRRQCASLCARSKSLPVVLVLRGQSGVAFLWLWSTARLRL